MSFLTDVFEGNFGNLGHDLTAHFKEDLPYYGLAAAGLTGGLGLAGLGPAAGLGGLFGGAGAAEAGAGSALGFAGEAGAAGGTAEGAGGLSGFLADPAAAGLSGGSGSEAVTDALGWSSLAGDPGLGGGVIGPSLPSDPGLGGGLIGPEWTGGGPGGGVSFGAEAGATPAAGGSAGTGSGGSFVDSLISGAKSSFAKNPLGIGAAGLGLGMNLLKGNPTDPNQAKLQQQADQLGAQGQVLQQYLANGTLPPAMKASMDQATAAAKARITSNHAKNGMSTDPSQNSALAQELNAVDINAVAAMADAQINMMKTGLTETGLSSQLYEMLTKMDRQNNTDLMNAISAFAAQLGGGSRSVSLKLG